MQYTMKFHLKLQGKCNPKINDFVFNHLIFTLFFDEICKRSPRFILSCIQSESSFAHSIVRYGIFSVIVSLLLVEMLCSCVHISTGSSMILFVAMLVSTVTSFLHNFYSRVENDD